MITKKMLLDALGCLGQRYWNSYSNVYSFLQDMFRCLPDDEPKSCAHTIPEIPEWEKRFEEQQRLNAYPKEGQWMKATKEFIHKEFKKMGEEILTEISQSKSGYVIELIVLDALKRRGVE